MPARGWYSGDDHIHLRRSPRENDKIVRWTAAEDVHVGNLLQMGDFWNYVFSPYAFGEEGRYRGRRLHALARAGRAPDAWRSDTPSRSAPTTSCVSSGTTTPTTGCSTGSTS